MTAYTFPQLINFTRTSAATYVNSAGLVTLTPASTNLFTFTQDFDNAAWIKTAANAYFFDPSTATYGAELVVNGDFASGTTGWGASNSTLSVVGGALRVTTVSTGIYADATQTIQVVAGRTYLFTFSGTYDANGAGYGIISGALPSTGAVRSGSYYVTATSTGAALITLRVAAPGSAALPSAGNYADYDNVSVREVIGGLITAPDGTPSGEILIPTATTGAHNVQQTGGGFGLPVTMSTYAKAGTSSFLQLSHASGIGIFANFNLTTGALGTVGGSVSASIVNVGSGWYRCSMTFVPVSAANTRIGMVTSASAGYTESWTATGTETLYLWGAQLEQTPTANLTLGSDIVINGDFAGGSTGWTANTGWVIGAGVATATATNASLISSSAVTANKTYRVAFDVTSYTSGTLSVRVGAGTAQTVTGAGSKVLYLTAVNATGVEFYGGGITLSIDNVSVQEVTGATGMPTTYTRNFGGLFPPRFDYDPVTLAPKGFLVEEQRTNLMLRSEEFDNAFWVKTNSTVTANATTSPDGTVDADSLIENTSAGSHDTYGSGTLTAAAHTFSVYVKPNGRTWINMLVFQSGGGDTNTWFNLSTGTVGTVGAGATASIASVGNGWYRCSITFTALAAAASAYVRMTTGNNITTYTGDGTSGIFLWGAQLEAGAFATSYIPTAASTVTRAADISTLTYPYFAQWYNGVEGTFVMDYDVLQTTITSKAALTTNDGTSNNINIVYVSSSATIASEVRSGGAATSAVYPGSAVANVPIKTATAYRANDFAATSNGGAVSTDSSGAVALNQSELNIGYSRNYGGLYLNGHMRSIRYYPTRLTNAQLQALTI